jgi:branched-chain amino acid transport system permease protein
MKDLLNSKMKILAVVAGLLFLVALPLLYKSYWVSLFTQILIFAVLAMSLDILMGYTGLTSFGHAGFFGAAGYVTAILTTRYHQGFLTCFICSVSMSVLISMLFGFLVAHAGGVYFLIITLALGMTLWGLAVRWGSMTGGDNGISGVIRPDIGLPIILKDPLTFYYVVMVFFLIALLLMVILIRSPFGYSLKGVRESESRMRVLGYHTWLHKYLSYVVAAAFAGSAGVFWAYYNGFISPYDMDLNASVKVILMVILGGPGTLIGPAIGAGIIVFLENFLSAYTERWLLIMGSIYIFTIFYAPQGLVNVLWEWLKGRRKRAEAAKGEESP